MLHQPIEVAELRGCCREQVEAVLSQPCDSELTLDAATLRECMGKDDASILLRHTIGDDAVQKSGGPGATHLELGEGRHVHDAHSFANGLSFFGHRLEPVAAAETMFLLDAIGGKPFRLLPTENFREDSTTGCKLVIDRGRPDWPACRQLMTGKVYLKHMVIFVQ